MRLKGKRALVTGGASGIGLAIVRRFALEGASVYVCDRSKTDLARMLEESVARGVTIRGAAADVTKSDEISRLVHDAAASLGGLDLLVNNAGVGHPGSVTEGSEADWDLVMDVNLRAVYRVTRAVYPFMHSAGGGAIVNLSSLGGLVGSPGFAAYGASKAAVLQLTQTMAAEFAAQRIRVNCLCPGHIDTPMLWRTFRLFDSERPENIRDEMIKRVLLKRLGTPDEIAAGALFLASDDASFITGQSLIIDGGYRAN